MADPEFVLDAVIGFLTSPIWNSPVPTFIEQNCVVFDPDEENHESYKEIHDKYKQMVESLLSSFLKDIGITGEQFTAACKERGGNAQFNEIRQNVFEQVWAAEDFEVFKRLMIQKNIELQLQALQLIQQQGHKQALKPTASAPPSTSETNDEDEIMKEVLRISKDEYDKKTNTEKKEEEILQKTLSESHEEHESSTNKPNRKAYDLKASQSITKALEDAEDALERRLRMLAQREKGELEKALKTCTLSEPEKTKESEIPAVVSVMPPPSASTAESSKSKPKEETKPQKVQKAPEVSKPQEKAKPQEKVQGLPPISGTQKAKTPADAAANWMNSAKAEAAAASSSGSQQQGAAMSEEELKQRTEYLKSQRDKLLQMKKQQREKNLDKYTEDQPKSRPMSARVARTATSGNLNTVTPKAASPTDDKKLAMRKALANVLKREVIDKH